MQFPKKTRRSDILIILAASILVVASGCRPAAAPVSISDRPVEPYRMPRTSIPAGPPKPTAELSWKIFDGEMETIGDFEGKVLVLDFWATYCPPCIEEIPHLRELQGKYGDRGFQVIGLHVGGDEDRPKVPAFKERLSIDYPLATPEDALIYQLLGDDSRIPQTLVFDRKGELVVKLVSYDEEVKRRLDEAVEKAVNQ
ncbi:MAG: TlpA family protein disulfide reductase [Acidobacteria bacterium]|mgnify:CR=1 FL=1|nr:MAG: TlpA family protein disulfide reductase [Acidobacteriota bacterium]REK04074.1 MAG: TlpA family protein disulfide reductase [Acidobacteriota bacterium]REK15236.1 MAG: TlpA family protein disulfide reductase [Acidobacteriota bacterium]REK46326.1 MAG: TlpA family protein disulfide reductase [Acidobacteriota bacterium]